MSVSAPPDAGRAEVPPAAGRAEASATAGPSSGQQARQTLRVLAGSALGILPLLQLLTDTHWLVQAWICMAIVILPAALLRLRWAPHVAQLLPGLALLTCYLTRVYVPVHTWAWAFPTRGSWPDVQAMAHALGTTVSDSVAPLVSTSPIRLYLSAGLALLAVIVDFVAIELRRPALAGVPLLLVFTLAGAVPREAVTWIWFCLAAVGYLLILSSASSDDVYGWGRLVLREGRSSASRLTSALSGRQIGLTAIVIAVAIPFVVPLASANLVANALHNGHTGIGGNGSGGGVTIDPLATLRGQLTRGAPINLFTVRVSGTGSASAYYLRTTVLDDYNGEAWVQGPKPPTVQAVGSNFPTAPQVVGPSVDTDQFDATVSVQRVAGTPPLFAAPSDLVGPIPGGWDWSPRTGLIVGDVRSGQNYTEKVVQPSPSPAQLETAPTNPLQGISPADVNGLAQDLVVNDIPAQVSSLVDGLTATKTTPFDKAAALLNYFRNPANGFVYSLQTKTGDSGSDLVDFLTQGRSGYCQQYAAAMGVMLRLARIPARVVLGYTHTRPDQHGQFEVTTDDAHAWVEGYFGGIGWIPFDPTPLTGTDAGRAVVLPWNPLASNPAAGDTQAAHPTAGSHVVPASSSAGGSAAAKGAARDDTPIQLGAAGGTVLAVLALVLATPWLVRVQRRRRRLRQARTLGAEPLWDELADTARDLGLGWSPARTTRQVTAWLSELLDTETARHALHELAQRVERQRYAADGVSPGTSAAISDLLQVRASLMRTAAPRTSMRAHVLPASLRGPRGDHAGPAPRHTSSRTGHERAGSGSR